MAWNKATSILLPDKSPTQNVAIFINTYTPLCQICGVTVPMPPPNVWQTIDLTPMGVPTNALAVDLRGILILTDGANTSISDIAVSYQVPGGPFTPASYVEQTIAVGPSGGQRTNASDIVPCLNGKIQWAWMRGNADEWPDKPLVANWPQGASYGLNIKLEAIYMP